MLKTTRFLAALIFCAVSSIASAQTYTGLTWGLDRTSDPYKIGINLNGFWYNIGEITSSGAPTPYFSGSLQFTATDPAWTTQWGVSNPAKFSVGNTYATTEEFGQGTVPVVNGITGVVNAPSNSYLGFGLFTGTAGYALAGDNANSPVGMFGFGGRTGPGTTNYPGAWGFNTVTCNCSNTGNTHSDAVDHVQLYGGEIDLNIYSAGLNSLGVEGLYIVGGGNWVPIPSNLARGVDIDVLSVVGNIPFNEAFYTRDGAASVAGLSIGTTGVGNNVGSQSLAFRSRTSGAVNRTSIITTDADGNMLFNPSSGQLVALQDGAGGTVISTSTGVATIHVAPTFSTLTGYVKGAGASPSTASATIPLADLATQAATTFVANATGGVAAPTAINATTATSLLNAVVGDSGAGGTKGLVPAPAAGDAAASKFLKADGTWAAVGGGTGTVTSVAQSFTGGLISVSGSPVTTSGTLALTVAGTSGGIPYFSSASTWASSAALAANAVVLGGGAGIAPATTTTGTGVVTAIGNAVNTNGGLVTASTASIASGALLTGAGSGTAISAITPGTGIATWLATPSSANLAAALTDETGTGSAVFANSPTFVDDVTLGTQQTTRGSIILANTAAGAFATTLQGSNSASEAWTLTLPTTNGAANQFLQTDGLGVTTWATGNAGTVTSVAQSFTGGLISVGGSPITTTGTLALTVAGTSGGIPYFSSASTWATSAALTANAIVLGGGAGAAPAPLGSLGTTTTVLHGNAAGAPSFGAVALGSDVSGDLPFANLTQGATNTVLANATAGTADFAAFTMPSCDTATKALQWTTNTGFACNSAINAATLGGATFAAPGAIGGGTAAAGTFTSLTAATSHLVTGTQYAGFIFDNGTNQVVTFNGLSATNDNGALSLLSGGVTKAFFTADSGLPSYINNGNNFCIGSTTCSNPLSVTGASSVTTHALNSSGVPAASTCGTTPAVTANSSNAAGQFTTGTGTPTACTITFANAYPTAAFCTISPANAAASGATVLPYVSATSASAFTITMAAGTSSAAFNYVCGGK